MEKKIAKKLMASSVRPRTGIILGTGFASIASNVEADFTVDTNAIKGYPKVRVKGHSGQIVMGRLGALEVVLFAGRPHFYEGNSTADITLPLRIMKELGCNTVILTNAAGAVNSAFRPGEFAVIADHISNGLSNPLTGKNFKFVDMCNAYDIKMREDFKRLAKESKIKVHEAVYMYFSGPSFETPAEIRAARTLGADLVGMSTVAETIAARALDIKVFALSYISNMAASEGQTLNHNDFLESDKIAFDKIAFLIEKMCINN